MTSQPMQDFWDKMKRFEQFVDLVCQMLDLDSRSGEELKGIIDRVVRELQAKPNIDDGLKEIK